MFPIQDMRSFWKLLQNKCVVQLPISKERKFMITFEESFFCRERCSLYNNLPLSPLKCVHLRKYFVRGILLLVLSQKIKRIIGQ